jgi:glycosyltransferase involved in cell wall biosynthesis
MHRYVDIIYTRSYLFEQNIQPAMPEADIDTTVIIPVYEQPELLHEALRSVVSQTYNGLEIIVVDDNSDTDIAAVVDEYANARLITHSENKGAGAARNTGIEKANGKYVAFLDADDLWKPSKVKKQREVFLESGQNVGLVYTGFIQHETDGNEWEQLPEAAGNIYTEELEQDRIHPTSTVMVRQDVLNELGGFDESLPSRQDYDLWIRITEHYEVGYVQEILVEKREQKSNISNNFDKRIEGDLKVFEKVKRRISDCSFVSRNRILSYHHHVIGRDYDSNDNRSQALKHLAVAILRYPFRPISYAMFIIALFDIDRNGRTVSLLKQYVR